MARNQKMKRGWCPFVRGKCKEKCVFYRTGFKHFEASPGQPKPEPMPFEECAINIFTDVSEQMITRQVGIQKSLESTRNAIAKFNDVFISALAGAAERRAIEDAVSRGLEMRHVSEMENDVHDGHIEADFAEEEAGINA